MDKSKAKTYNKAKKINPNRLFIPKVDILEDYYVSRKGKAARKSPTESIIATILTRNKMHYVMEVSFRKFGFPYSPYRFDFYLPLHGVIIEYDGEHHNRTHVKENDRIKNKFCKVNNIKIFRFNKKHYPNLAFHVEKLLKNFNNKN